MKKLIKSCYFLIIMLIIYVPIATMIFLSFNSGRNVDDFTDFSFKWYKYLIEYSPFIKSITVSLFVAMISTVISIIIGVMACYGLTRIRKRTANRWVRVANIPLINADVITAVSLMIIFVLAGIKFGIVTLIAAHVSFNVPYVIVTVLPFMNRIDKNLIDASRDLGGTQRQTFFKVILPILLPSIITATAISFAMSFDDFIISYFTGGDQTNVSTFIYTAKKITPYINAFGTILVVTIVLIILIWNAIQITTQSIKENKLKIKNGTYKLKEKSNLEKKIIYYKKCIETKSQIIVSLNLFYWFKYKFLQLQYKRLSNKNLNTKISKLEWKKEILLEKINSDRKAQSVLAKYEAKKEQIISKNKNKKIQNFDLLIQSIDKKIVKFQQKVDLIQEQKIESQKAIEQLQKDIEIYKEDLSKEKNPNKKLTDWYNAKINELNAQIIILKEGKNNYKLKQTIDKLGELKNKIENRMLSKYNDLQVWKRKVKKIVSFGHRFDTKESSNNLSIKKEQLIENKINKYTSLIETTQLKLDRLENKVSNKKEKYFPEVISEEVVVKNNIWIKRNWRKILMSTSVLAAFSLFTTAYILNNSYDLIIGNWGSYIAPGVIEGFEKQEGIKINYQQYDSNESLYNKTYTFDYDIMVPSEYMVKKLAEEDKLQKIDYNCIKKVNKPGVEEKGACQFESIEQKDYKDSNGVTAYTIMDGLQNILDKTKINVDESILDYSVNWFWGDVRMAFNIGTDDGNPRTELINFMKERDLFLNSNEEEDPFKWEINPEKLSWNILWEAADAGFDLKLNEDPKNVFMYAFEKMYGLVDVNSTEESEKQNSAQKEEKIDAAAVEISKLLNHSNVGLYGDNIMDAVHAKNYDIAVIYNGDLIWATAPDFSSDDDDDDTSSDEQATINKIDEEDEWVYTTLSATPQFKHDDFKEGTNVWSDNLVFSKTNKNLELSYKFINYMNDYDIQKKQVEEATAAVLSEELKDEIIGNDENKEGWGDPWTQWYEPITQNAKPFGFDKKWDNYLVDKFNQIISTKH
ncbi:spermidine/putrescine ABC transporter permease [Spiroplasma litorale]|uniref:Spermidine/putrescine ABC transporter permease n=1 Tax=Spiroplasma litorale TaxID=216942 RepID=A0A0K1W0G4_9MOLU|nr:spermidine/putrescine ABC transporter permease/substrate-binding protein [Spiroplasma litorale]AKX33789.1 spermidine/putrescine ABC transporter permease [Spiroplasma litorale]